MHIQHRPSVDCWFRDKIKRPRRSYQGSFAENNCKFKNKCKYKLGKYDQERKDNKHFTVKHVPVKYDHQSILQEKLECCI